jgi:homoserine kinase
VTYDDILIPGSVANLGGGFDTLGVAVQLFLRVRIAEVLNDGIGRLTVRSSEPPVSGDNAVERAYRRMVERQGGQAPSVVVDVVSDIPMAAGLGSSAAATAAGLRVFERVVGPVADGVLLQVATEIEGHGDNAAPALFGGLHSVVDDDGGLPRALGWTWPEALRLIVATPFTGLATSKARAVLSASLPRRDAIFNLQRVLALVHGLQHGEYDSLREAFKDRWHQPERTALVPHLGPVLAIDDPDVLGAFLSGAGPSVAVVARQHYGRVAHVLEQTCISAGVPVVVRILAVHERSRQSLTDALASVGGGAA